MTDTHVVSALKDKRMVVAGQIETLQAQLRQAVIDLDHVEAALRLFDPDVEMAALPPRKVAPVLYDTKGDTGRTILDTLRNAARPLSTASICIWKSRRFRRPTCLCPRLPSAAPRWPDALRRRATSSENACHRTAYASTRRWRGNCWRKWLRRKRLDASC
jgi:hypothetical protein